MMVAVARGRSRLGAAEYLARGAACLLGRLEHSEVGQGVQPLRRDGDRAELVASAWN